ncbi:hypothetical protein FB451DRAFT_1192964 [Mycena latifolia]|nr:hypothetical protein FB451DRAFT_1192964 [Mycena latifolia]
MAKRKCKAITGEITDESKEEKAERNRATYKRYYQKKGYRQPSGGRTPVKFIVLNKRETTRAEKKAAKRRWDPPKKVKSEVQEHEQTDESVSIGDEQSGGVLGSPQLGARSQTPVPCETAAPRAICVAPMPAEEIAMLTDFKRRHGHRFGQTSLINEVIGDTLGPRFGQTSVVHQVIGDKSAGGGTCLRGAPTGFASRNDIQTGSWGPIDGSRAQLGPHDPSNHCRGHHVGDNYAPIPPYCTTMGSNRWDEFYYWLEAVMLVGAQNEWDRAVQLAFARAGKTWSNLADDTKQQARANN